MWEAIHTFCFQASSGFSLVKVWCILSDNVSVNLIEIHLLDFHILSSLEER